MSSSQNYVLWENDDFTVYTPHNPHLPYSEGPHVYVTPKHEFPAAWDNTQIATKAFGLASEVCAIMKNLDMSPWFNIQANGNWGLLAGRTPYFHLHIYGRNKTKMWAKPIVLPEAPNTYSNEPMPEKDRLALSEALKSLPIEN